MDANELDERCAALARAIFPHNNDTNSRLRVERAASALMAAIAPNNRLVRENEEPPAEPDQDVLDTREVLSGYFRMQDFIHQIESGSHDGQPAFIRTKQALTEIKARVRREAIMALPDEVGVSHPLWGAADVSCRDWKDALAAIKQVYGK